MKRVILNPSSATPLDTGGIAPPPTRNIMLGKLEGRATLLIHDIDSVLMPGSTTESKVTVGVEELDSRYTIIKR